MDSLMNWFAMNGYGSYIWTAYALWALGFAWLIGGTLLGRKRVWAQLGDQQRRNALKAAQGDNEQRNSEQS
ncbi:MAG: heme exporter protein CcmD [Gammaproteobacteria bacterium]|nr:heme exporter protein CcmD [Gammaproteobacteria bacterium]